MKLSDLEQTVPYKTFLATYHPTGEVIRIMIVKRPEQLFANSPADWAAFFYSSVQIPNSTSKRPSRLWPMAPPSNRLFTT